MDTSYAPNNGLHALLNKEFQIFEVVRMLGYPAVIILEKIAVNVKENQNKSALFI
jgi:hypothetical protein